MRWTSFKKINNKFVYSNLSKFLNLYYLDEQLNLYYPDGSPYFNRVNGVNCLKAIKPFVFYFCIPMVPTNGMWSGVKETPINFGFFDNIKKKKICCSIGIGYVYIKSATWKSEITKGGKTIRGNFCFFELRVFSKDRASFKDFIIQTNVQDLSFYVLIINHYISTYKELDSMSIDKLIDIRHIGGYDKLRGTAVYMVDNTTFADFVKYLYSAECITHTSCSYSFRKGEYRHSVYTSLLFRTQIVAFHNILACVLKGKSSKEDSTWLFTYKTEESVDYSGGISVGHEEEGEWNVMGDTHLKDDIIKEIINKTYSSFPEKKTIICQMIDLEMTANWNE